ncbi:matrix extracellular phosphoglycoprotein [Trichosurus vulpecula]|uniref:matrix extracellular phosphoglycoprotein n=1 Tax=Trichosurus vulpecula TaxID=9337 RepID=UPI00186ABEBE|nr:matrix extracellular phosphoglycoprotein [Trichosurus vulpecula]
MHLDQEMKCHVRNSKLVSETGLQNAWKQKEDNKDRVPVHHFDKGNKQEISSKGNVIQESDKSQDISGGKQMLIKDQGTGSSKTSHHDFKDTIYTGFTGNAKVAHGKSVSKDLPDQEAHDVILINKNGQHGRKHASAPKFWVVEEDGEENKIVNSIYNKLERVKHPKAQGKGNEDIANNQRDVQNQNIPGDHRAISHVQYSTDYSKLSLKHIKFPHDFEGSGQGKEDNDFSSSSREMVVPDTEITDGYTSVPDPDKANVISSNSKLLIGKEGNNEVSEKEEYDLNSNGGTGDIGGTDVSKTPRKEKNIIDKQIIRGSTNYKELPGNGGDGFDANTGDAYQESVGIRHSQGSLKKQSTTDQHVKKGSNDIIEGKEISKHGKDNSKTGVESSKRDQKTKNDKEKKIHYGYSKERSITQFSSNSRKNHYAAHRKFSSTPEQKRFWGPINAHSRKKFKSPKRNDSSDSSSSDSSDSDSDESTEYFQGGSGN